MRTHSVSLSCWLSAESPVLIAKSIARRDPSPAATGLEALKRFICRIAASSMCGFIASHGRHAAEKGEGLSIGSISSTRVGDSSSASWKSESCPKYPIERRRPSRPGLASEPSSWRSTWASPGAEVSVRNGASPVPTIRCSSVE
jgi:hypothetical protein